MIERTDDEILDDTDADEVVTDLDDEAVLVLAVREMVPLVCEAADRKRRCTQSLVSGFARLRPGCGR